MDIKKIFKDTELKKILAIFIAIKITIIIIGLAAHLLIPAEYTQRQKITDNIFLNPWAQYDGRAYLDIAKNGYNSEFLNGASNYGWYPLYPLLIRIFSFIGYDMAAFIISNVASFFAVVFLYLLLKDEFNTTVARKTILYILLFPTAYFMTMMYTESLFLLFSAGCFYFARKERWLEVGIFGFLASLTRMQGVILFIPMIYMYFDKRGFSIRNADRNILCLFLIPLGLLTFLAYDYAITGDPFIQFYTQSKFGRHLSMPWEGFASSLDAIIKSNNGFVIFYNIYNISLAMIFLLLTLISYKTINKEYSIYVVLSLVLPLFSTTLQAISRFNLMLFPVFIIMAKLSENEKHDKVLKVLFVLSAILMILFTIRHVNTFIKGVDF